MIKHFYQNAEKYPNALFSLLTIPDPCINMNASRAAKKNKKNKIPPLSLFSLHGNGDTIRICQEIQCLPCAGFFTQDMQQTKNQKQYFFYHKGSPYVRKAS